MSPDHKSGGEEEEGLPWWHHDSLAKPNKEAEPGDPATPGHEIGRRKRNEFAQDGGEAPKDHDDLELEVIPDHWPAGVPILA